MTWRGLNSYVHKNAPQLGFGDRSIVAKELWSKYKEQWLWDRVDRACMMAWVFVAVVLATALALQNLVPSKPPLSTSVRLREIQKLVAELA